ncbi:General negative regulator of transcription subunit 2 [Pleurostoma richardsiae]|uniref:General negative regulator of transcription subunit 2 n=1 Tax=Pleurostoma richardsiae TaxID=41990 RepID=A0AA38RJI3_9PEZI|nr:General negative regulator of transcription subunit 2 [Pleurostoma richardsiae]
MNRPGAVPQSLRGIPAGFGGQQQPQQPGRAVSNRLPNGKLGNNGSGWAFGGGVPMGGAASLQNPNRQMGGNVSFAQSLSGSTPATPLDLSEFPSLSGNAQVSNASQPSMWSNPPSRNMSGPIQRNQPTPTLSSQQSQQDDLFAPPSRLSSAQSSFRFGAQGTASQPAQSQTGNSDDFPPLSRNVNGEIGSERGASLMTSLGFGSQGSASASSTQASRAGNGLLNALSATSRAAEARSPVGTRSSQDARSPTVDEELRHKDSLTSQPSIQDSASQSAGPSNPLGAIGNDAPSSKAKDEKDDDAPQPHDPLEGMAPIDKFGLKGLRTLMNNYPDYNALICGIDPASLGLDLSSSEPLSSQVFSLFDDVPPRPSIPKFRLPECYNVTNVQPIEHKIPSFNEETLMWIFYSSPGDIKQHWAAAELHNRNWRWHKKLQIWLTKDDMLLPQVLSPNHERGYYIIWDTVNWRKERREFTLQYADLEAAPAPIA